MTKVFLFFGVMLSCLIACGNENTGAGPDISMDSAKYYNPAISYGTLKDSRDGQVYRTVQIGVQTWMAENLNYDYNVGTAASYCYNDSKDSCAKYGRLYTWSAAMDSAAIFSHGGKGCGDGVTCYASGKVQGVCPAGWHLPDTTEWKALINYVDLQTTDDAGYALKATSGWRSRNGVSGDGSDEFGFGALPAGFTYYSEYRGVRLFKSALDYTAFWTSTEYIYVYETLSKVETCCAYLPNLHADRTLVGDDEYDEFGDPRHMDYFARYGKDEADPVRCVKD